MLTYLVHDQSVINLKQDRQKQFSTSDGRLELRPCHIAESSEISRRRRRENNDKSGAASQAAISLLDFIENIDPKKRVVVKCGLYAITYCVFCSYSPQIQFSLLSRYPLTSGLAEVCDELGIRPIAYSPLALGLLTDKYTIDKYVHTHECYRLPFELHRIAFLFMLSANAILTCIRTLQILFNSSPTASRTATNSHCSLSCQVSLRARDRFCSGSSSPL